MAPDDRGAPSSAGRVRPRRPLDVTAALDRLAELVNDNPERRQRFDAWLEELPVADVQTAIRLPQAVLDRADALVEKLAADPVLTAMGGPTRSGVLRLAIALGLEQLEKGATRGPRVANLVGADELE